MQNLLIAMTCRQFMELIGQSQGSGRHTVWTVNGGFHLYLFELTFINQFYSRKTRLVQLSLAND